MESLEKRKTATIYRMELTALTHNENTFQK